MQQNNHDALAKSKRLYKYAFIFQGLIIFLVFMEPVYQRLVNEVWARGKLTYIYTFSLDVHSLIGIVILFFFLYQIYLGYKQQSAGSFRQMHQLSGKFLYYVLMPMFLLSSAWVLIDRLVNIPAEQSLVFHSYRFIILTVISLTIIWIGINFYRAYIAVKEGDILMHLDFILAGVISIGAFAYLRLFVILTQPLNNGSSPFTIPGLYFITATFSILLMTLFYILAGRLKHNANMLMIFIAINIFIAIAGWDYYKVLSV